jgi:3-methyladenine DNA glycosylase AlkD
VTLAEAMAELERLGTEQNRKIYRRHGAGENQFGVSFGSLRALAKRINVDHELAEALWTSGNADARALATMVVDPARLSATDLHRWLEGLDYYVLVDLLAGVAARTEHAGAMAEKWTASSDDHTGQAGWDLVGLLAASDDGLPDAYFEEKLGLIEATIQVAPNRTRHAMNGALIGIGGRNPRLRPQAIAAGKRIGKVEVDHGETGCQTPAAVPYIEKIWARRAAPKRSAQTGA